MSQANKKSIIFIINLFIVCCLGYVYLIGNDKDVLALAMGVPALGLVNIFFGLKEKIEPQLSSTFLRIGLSLFILWILLPFFGDLYSNYFE